MPRLKRNKLLFFFVRLIVVVGLYFIIALRIDWVQIYQLVTPSVVPYFILSASLILLQALFCSWRWQYIAQTHARHLPSLFFTFMVYLENLFFNQFLPATLGGDVLRVVRWQGAGVGGAVAASTVLLDRLSGLNGAAIMSFFIVPLVAGDSNQILTALAAASMSGLVLVSTAGLFFIMRWPQIIAPFRRYGKIWAIFNKVRANIFFDRHYLYALGLSVLGYVIGGLSTATIARGFHIEVDIFFIVVLSSLITLVSTIPITISGWGLREATFVTILSPLGVDQHQAFLLGLFVGLVSLVSALPGGLVTIADLTKAENVKF